MEGSANYKKELVAVSIQYLFVCKYDKKYEI